MPRVLPLHTYGDPLLRIPAKEVTLITPDIRELLENMFATLKVARGVGLAAQQVGRTEAVLVLDVPPDYDVDDEGETRLNPDVQMPMAIINPRLVKASRSTETCEEGCLSFPEITGAVKRAWEVEVEYLDLDGTRKTVVMRGFMARAIQHEMDHLQGKLFVDRFSHVKRLALRNRLRDLQLRTREKLGIESPL